MWAYAEANRPGNVMAPKEFLAQLRRDTGVPELTCWWEPDEPRDVIMDGHKETRQGCWVVYMKTRVARELDYHGYSLTVVHDQWIHVYKLNGDHGCPTVLGAWVAECLNQADMSKRGYDRNREINDALEAAQINPLIQNRLEVEDMFRDRFVKRVFQMHADKFGTPTRIKEDVDKELRRLERQQRAAWDRHHKEAKEHRVYQERA